MRRQINENQDEKYGNFGRKIATGLAAVATLGALVGGMNYCYSLGSKRAAEEEIVRLKSEGRIIESTFENKVFSPYAEKCKIKSYDQDYNKDIRKIYIVCGDESLEEVTINLETSLTSDKVNNLEVTQKKSSWDLGMGIVVNKEGCLVYDVELDPNSSLVKKALYRCE